MFEIFTGSLATTVAMFVVAGPTLWAGSMIIAGIVLGLIGRGWRPLLVGIAVVVGCLIVATILWTWGMSTTPVDLQAQAVRGAETVWTSLSPFSIGLGLILGVVLVVQVSLRSPKRA